MVSRDVSACEQSSPRELNASSPVSLNHEISSLVVYFRVVRQTKRAHHDEPGIQFTCTG